MKIQPITIFILALILGFAGGYLYSQSSAPAAETAMEVDHVADKDSREEIDSVMDHHHDQLDISQSELIPTLDIEILKDPKSGINVHLLTTNFTFAPEHASTEHVEGEGHAHIYVDDVKISRVYGEWFHLDNLDAGEREIRVTLNANSHQELAIEGESIAATETVSIE
jgi:hypothetical protein